MGSLKVRVDVRTEGPLANGEAEKAAQEWTQNVTQALGDKAVELLRAFPMNKTGRARGGFGDALKTKRMSPTLVRVPGPTREGVSWAPWLEGTSKRNEGNKFKGYGLFKKTRTQLNKLAPQVAQEELEKVLPRMGGD